MKNLIVVAVVAMLVQGCATPYQASSFLGGYTETQLDENVFQVSFVGNGYTGRKRAADFTLLRSAELTLENRYKYFAVIDRESVVSTSTTPSSFYTTYNAYGATTTQIGGWAISKPSTSNTVVMYKEKPDAGFAYNAEFVRDGIRKKYGIDPETLAAEAEKAEKKRKLKQQGQDF